MKDRKQLEIDFLNKSKSIYNNLFNYDKVIYVNNHTPITLICNKCGKEFTQRPDSHIKGKGCIKCNKIISQEEFIKRSINKHGNKYDYTETIYNHSREKVKIYCNTCKKFFYQTPLSHWNGHGCLNCVNKKQRFNNETFIKLSKEIHGEFNFDYSELNYINNKTKIKLICTKCNNTFSQSPTAHLYLKHGCPYCKESKGEKEINNYLIKQNILFIREKRFNDCKDKLPLPFDFYLPDDNVCIEFDGEQHYKIYEKWGGLDKYEYTKKHDNIKNEYCISNNIKLYRIKYDENITDKLSEIVNNLNK